MVSELSVVLLLLFHLLVYAFPSILSSLLDERGRLWLNYIYVGVLFVLVQLFDNLYGVEVWSGFVINGGDIAYTALIFASLYIMVTQTEPRVVRNLIYIISILSVFLFLLFGVIRWATTMGAAVNYLDFPVVYLEYSFRSLFLTLVLYSSELFLVLYLIRKIFHSFESEQIAIVSIALGYYVVVVIDGILYPMGYNFLFTGYQLSIVQGVMAKLIFGLGFSTILVLLLLMKPERFAEFLSRETPFIEYLLPPSYHNLRKRLDEVSAELKVLHQILPICSYCKRIRDEDGQWQQLERYLDEHNELSFSHGLCPDCSEREMRKLDGI